MTRTEIKALPVGALIRCFSYYYLVVAKQPPSMEWPISVWVTGKEIGRFLPWQREHGFTPMMSGADNWNWDFARRVA
jgi:hypothetical protein